jgi:hypothetical protein
MGKILAIHTGNNFVYVDKTMDEVLSSINAMISPMKDDFNVYLVNDFPDNGEDLSIYVVYNKNRYNVYVWYGSSFIYVTEIYIERNMPRWITNIVEKVMHLSTSAKKTLLFVFMGVRD